MLGFILSKMQMLLFAVGISIVALLLLGFISNIGLQQEANSVLFQSKKVIEEQLNTESLCTDKFINIPDSLVYGFDRKRYFYDLGFAVEVLGSGDTQASALLLSISEHRKGATERRYISSARITSDASFVLVDSTFLLEGSGLLNSFNANPVFFNPRAASTTTAVVEGAPNSFAVLKDTQGGKVTLYIIPCTTLNSQYTCQRNILRVGCYLLKQQNPPSDSNRLASCFNIETEMSIDKSKNYTWGDCKLYFPEITNNP